MESALHLLDQFADIVELDAFSRPQIPSPDRERSSSWTRSAAEGEPQQVVDRVLERPTSSHCLRPQAAGHVIIQRYRRSLGHINMLPTRHLDVKRGTLLS